MEELRCSRAFFCLRSFFLGELEEEMKKGEEKCVKQVGNAVNLKFSVTQGLE